MTSSMLDIEIRVLVVKYGFDNVLKALAGTSAATVDEIRQMLDAQERRPRGKRRSPRPLTASEVVATLKVDSSTKREVLVDLAQQFDGKVLFSELRHVLRFLEQHRIDARPKSRASSVRVLFSHLAQLSDEELKNLAAESRTGGDSWYSDLSSEIIGKTEPPPNSE